MRLMAAAHLSWGATDQPRGPAGFSCGFLSLLHLFVVVGLGFDPPLAFCGSVLQVGVGIA